MRKSLSFCMESNCSTLIEISVTFLKLQIFNTAMCLLALTTDCDKMTTQVGDVIDFLGVLVIEYSCKPVIWRGGAGHCLHSLMDLDVQDCLSTK